MCLDPISLIGAAVSAAGTMYSAASSAASYRAQAKFAERQSMLESQKGAYEAQRLNDASTRQISKQRGAFLSNGIDLSGSALDVIADSATEASLDEQTIKSGAKIESDNQAFTAKMAEMNASNAMFGGALGAISPFINAFSEKKQRNQQRTFVTNPYAQAGGLY
jgi:hypothetical protein